MTHETIPLSEREHEILALLVTGATNQEIADSLSISVNTVKAHVRNIFGKIGATTRTEAVSIALRHGLIPSPAQPVAVVDLSPPAVVAPNLPVEPAPATRRLPILALLALLVVLLLIGVIVALLLRQPVQPVTTSQSPASAGTTLPLSRWVAGTPLPEPRAGSAAVAFEGRLYLIGGSDDAGTTGSVLRFDPLTGVWTALSDKPTPVRHVQAALVNGLIYVPGGETADGSVLDRLEIYDPREDRWSSAAALPEPRSGYGLAALEGKLYLIGGWDGTQVRDQVLIYDPEEDRWQTGTPMPTARAYLAAVAADGKIFVLGGEGPDGPLASHEIYIPSQEGERPWRPAPPMPQAVSRFGAANLLTVIYVFGGGGAVSSFDIRSESWKTLDTPPQPIGEFPAVVASDDLLFVLGGNRDQRVQTMALQFRAVYVTNLPSITR